MTFEYTLLSDYMIFILKYYYGLENPSIYKDAEHIYVRDKQKKYMLYTIENLIEFNEVIKLTSINNEYFDRIVATKDNDLYIYYHDKAYALIEITREERRNQELINNINKVKIRDLKEYNFLNRSNWYFLWCNKTDYFREKNKYYVDNTNYYVSDYYIGMAESAIQYYNSAISKEKTNKSLYVSHKRITKKLNTNPINIVIDRAERDIAEYVKYLILKGEYTDECDKYLTEKIYKNNLNPELIFARLLFPTHYFDMCETVILNNKNKILTSEQVIYYEKKIKNVYKMLSKIKKIKKIDWL